MQKSSLKLHKTVVSGKSLNLAVNPTTTAGKKLAWAIASGARMGFRVMITP